MLKISEVNAICYNFVIVHITGGIISLFIGEGSRYCEGR